jgi:hypothetical protein
MTVNDTAAKVSMAKYTGDDNQHFNVCSQLFMAFCDV